MAHFYSNARPLWSILSYLACRWFYFLQSEMFVSCVENLSQSLRSSWCSSHLKWKNMRGKDEYFVQNIFSVFGETASCQLVSFHVARRLTRFYAPLPLFVNRYTIDITRHGCCNMNIKKLVDHPHKISHKTEEAFLSASSPDEQKLLLFFEITKFNTGRVKNFSPPFLSVLWHKSNTSFQL